MRHYIRHYTYIYDIKHKNFKNVNLKDGIWEKTGI